MDMGWASAAAASFFPSYFGGSDGEASPDAQRAASETRLRHSRGDRGSTSPGGSPQKRPRGGTRGASSSGAGSSGAAASGAAPVTNGDGGPVASSSDGRRLPGPKRRVATAGGVTTGSPNSRLPSPKWRRSNGPKLQPGHLVVDVPLPPNGPLPALSPASPRHGLQSRSIRDRPLDVDKELPLVFSANVPDIPEDTLALGPVAPEPARESVITVPQFVVVDLCHHRRFRRPVHMIRHKLGSVGGIVEYEMDLEDERFLEQINAGSRQPLLDPDKFEEIMDVTAAQLPTVCGCVWGLVWGTPIGPAKDPPRTPTT